MWAKLALVVVVASARIAMAAPCHVGDVEASSDADLKVLAGVTCLHGNLELTRDVANLAPLGSLKTIEGSLSIRMSKQLSSLKALNVLERITGSVWIGGPKAGVPKLRDIDGFARLVEIGGDLHLAGGYIFIPGKSLMHQVTKVSGFPRLERVGGSVTLFDLDGFRGLNGLVSIGKDLEISHAKFAVLSGFAKLTTIGGVFRFNGNARLRRIDGLGALAEIGGDVVVGCPNVNDVLGEAVVRKRIEKVTVKGTFRFVGPPPAFEDHNKVCY